MISYKYTAMSPNGTKVNGVVEAIDEYTAVAQIKQTCPVVLSIKEIQPAKKSFLEKDINPHVDEKALAVMCSQFSTILHAGVDVASAMEMIGKQTTDKKLKRMLLEGAKDVSQGNSMAISMEKNCEGLPVTFTETIRAGELSGTLEESFATLHKYYDKSYKIKQKVRQALSYPIFVVIVAIVVLLIVMVKVIPTLTAVFADLGGNLPFITVLLINMSNWFARWWMLLVLILIVLWLLFMIWKKTPEGKIVHARHQLHMPVLGKINTYTGCADFANTLSALLQAGLPLTDALRTTSKVLSNALLSQETKKLSEKVETGQKLGDAMRNSKIYPDTLVEMTAIGENTGELEETLATVGDYYTNESSNAQEAAISKLEPALLIFLAFFAGFIVIAIYMPMFTMYDLM